MMSVPNFEVTKIEEVGIHASNLGLSFTSENIGWFSILKFIFECVILICVSLDGVREVEI